MIKFSSMFRSSYDFTYIDHISRKVECMFDESRQYISPCHILDTHKLANQNKLIRVKILIIQILLDFHQVSKKHFFKCFLIQKVLRFHALIYQEIL